MENNMPIDDLFRHGLASGEEPMSETAWSNMERMLNGENPYTDETSRKRRILPWLLGGGLVIALSVGGWWLQRQANPVSSNANASIETIASPAPANQTTTSNNEGLTTASSTTNNQASQSKHISFRTGSMNHTPANASSTKQKQEASSPSATEPNELAITSPTPLPQTASASTTETTATPQKTFKPRKASRAVADHSHAGKSKLSNEGTTVPTSSPVAIANNNEVSETRNTNTRHPRTKTVQPENVAKLQTSVAEQQAEKKLLAVQVPKRVASPVGIMPEAPLRNEPRSKQITKVELNERVNRTRDGDVRMSGFDTLSISSSQEPTPTAMPRWMQPDADGKYHPRYVVLNAAEEAMAQQQRAIEHNSGAETMPTQSAQSTVAAATSAKIATKTTPDESTRKQSKESSMDRLRSKAAILGSDWSSISGKSIPGMSMGVHAAINNPKNNFGGFQFGLNNMKPFGDYFSLLAEVKFFIRNNSGYSIRDIMTTNKNLSVDTMSSPAQTIYSYQVDSLSRLYNFKHFYALELPVIFQFHYRRLTAYAGLNMAYQFRINTSTVQRNFVVNHFDTLLNQVSFSMQPEQGQDVLKNDFHARWGLGVVGGVSYSFNPQLYVDMRLVRNLNDNAQTLAARDVSANTFKVPNVQLSLGYRFRKFVPQQ